MKLVRIAVILMIVTGFAFSTAYAMKHTPEERGKMHFSDAKLGGGTAGKSCNTCHPGGSGLENAADKKEFRIMGKTQKSLEEAINACIEMAMGGKAVDPKSDQMKDMVAFMKSLKGMMMEKTMPMKKQSGK